MKQITNEQATVIDMFLAERWSEFEDHCHEQGFDSADFEDLLTGEQP